LSEIGIERQTVYFVSYLLIYIYIYTYKCTVSTDIEIKKGQSKWKILNHVGEVAALKSSYLQNLSGFEVGLSSIWIFSKTVGCQNHWFEKKVLDEFRHFCQPAFNILMSMKRSITKLLSLDGLGINLPSSIFIKQYFFSWPKSTYRRAKRKQMFKSTANATYF
jgi:hypothetical protein